MNFSSEAHNRLNFDIASESIALLKNSNDFLPLKVGQKIFVTGPSATIGRDHIVYRGEQPYRNIRQYQ